MWDAQLLTNLRGGDDVDKGQGCGAVHGSWLEATLPTTRMLQSKNIQLVANSGCSHEFE